MCKIKSIQCDNGSEFDNGLFQDFCNSNGIVFHFSCPQTSLQSGKSECKLWTINNMVRSLLAHASIPPSFWPHATYLHNIFPSKLLYNKSPLKCLTLVSKPLSVYVIRCFHPLLFTNFNLELHRVSSLGIR